MLATVKNSVVNMIFPISPIVKTSQFMVHECVLTKCKNSKISEKRKKTKPQNNIVSKENEKKVMMWA